jgi:putrescine transport system substrate-binding protein
MSMLRGLAGLVRLTTVCLAAALMAGCGHSHVSAAAAARRQGNNEPPVLNVYNWLDYIKPEVLHKFESDYGIKVHYDTFDSMPTLEAKLLTGHTGYDVAFPSGAYLERLITAGVFRPLDPTQLPNLANMDPEIMQRLAAHDPDNAHAIPYAWGITGFAYDAVQIRQRLPNAPVGSWAMLFDPAVVSHFADCGIGLYESPNIIVPSVLAWLGLPPNSEDESSLKRAQAALMAVRPYIRTITSGALTSEIASGDLCLIIASNGDAMHAREQVREAGKAAKIQIRYSIPREGAVMWVDTAAILADAPHPENAHLFLDFLMDPAVAAENTDFIHFPNANAAAQGMVRKDLTNAAIMPDPQVASRLIAERAKSEAYVVMRTRMWTRFRTGE